MKTSKQLLLLGTLASLPAAALAADGGANMPDISQWECKACPPIARGWSGTVDAGVGNVSGKSSKFGEYTGLNKDGGFVIGDGSARFRGDDGYYWNIEGSDLGLKSRSLDAEGGRQGKYKLRFKYDEIPHFIADGVQTPFFGNGGGTLGLPAIYPAAAPLPVPGTLQSVDLGTQRKRVGVGGSWIAAENWENAINFRHETKDGMKRTAGAFFALNASQLIEPVDTVTDQLDASTSYTGNRLQAKLAYYGSTFRNAIDSLTWKNPFTMAPGLGGADGRLALAPDNQFHQVQASLGYQISDRTRASGDIAWGRMTQNDNFIAPSITAPVSGLSLHGRASTLDASLKLSSAVSDQLRLNAAYTYSNRNNQTPQTAYTVVSTDLPLFTTNRTNLPYGFKQEKLKLSGDYKFTAQTRASVGLDQDRRARNFQEVTTTNEDTYWGKISTRPGEAVDLSLKLAQGKRRGSAYQPVNVIVPAENPLLRKYNMADRTRNSAALRMDIAAADTVNIGFGLESATDDYSGTSIGLTSGRDQGINADVSWVISEQTTLHAFSNRQEIKSRQAGSSIASTPNWSGENMDTIDTYGLGVKHAAIKDKLDLGADYVLSRSRSSITVKDGTANSLFPEMQTSLDSVKVYANYRLQENLSLLGSYWFEHYDTKNWMLDGVAPGTLATATSFPAILTFGEQAPRYNIHVVRVSLRYKF